MRLRQARRLLWTATGICWAAALAAGVWVLHPGGKDLALAVRPAEQARGVKEAPAGPQRALADYSVIWEQGLGAAGGAVPELPKNVAPNVRLCGTILEAGAAFAVVEVDGARALVREGETCGPVKVEEILLGGVLVEMEGKRSLLTLTGEETKRLPHFIDDAPRRRSQDKAPGGPRATGAPEGDGGDAQPHSADAAPNPAESLGGGPTVKLTSKQWSDLLARARLVPVLDSLTGEVEAIRIASLDAGGESGGSPVMAGDVLLRFRGRKVVSPAVLTSMDWAGAARRRCELEFLRGGEERRAILEIIGD